MDRNISQSNFSAKLIQPIHQRIKRCHAQVRSFVEDRRGAVAMIFALAIIPLMLGAGVAIDYSRAQVVKNRLGLALDATALAVGSSELTDAAAIEQLAQDYFKANYPASELGVPGNLNLTVTSKTVTIIATADLPTTIMRIAGINDLTVNASVEVTRETNRLEVVMVLDNTGSMNFSGKLDALKTAAADLVNILSAEQPNPDMLKFALVPFSASVNVGSQYRDSGWIDINKENSLHGVQFAGSENVFTIYNKLTNKSWNGCVEARPAPLDTLDTPPTTGDTLWVPYFAPDEPDNSAAWANGYWSYPNNYLHDNVPDPADNNLVMRQQKKNKYDNKSVSGDGPHYNCKNAPITPLTNDRATILSSISNMIAGGYTLIPIGLAWGWRVISPDLPFTQGASYDDKQTKKAIILLTDGLNDIGARNNHNKSRYNGYGFVEQGRLGTTSASAAQAELDNKVAVLCENVKGKNITIYTITFQLSSSSTQTLFRNCATSPDKYFNSPDNATLQTAFKAIAKDLSRLRISK
jgi:Flp pilus assembly protein TadG